jgi:outer membrane protein assembly factor BamD
MAMMKNRPDPACCGNRAPAQAATRPRAHGALLRSVAAIFGLCVALSACSWLPEQADETKGWSAQKLYNAAKEELDSGGYERAVKLYEKLEARYPYGQYAQQAQIEIAYAYYKEKEPASAIAAADRFIKLYPNHPNLDYAYYLKGLANFNEDLGIMGPLAGQDLTERDPKAARESFDTFKELIQRFPDSKYVPDARQRMTYLINALAAHEVHVARYYMKRGAYLAAANRAQTAMKTFPQAPANEEGLVIMVRAYDALGMNDLRSDAERVLLKNFPDSKYIAGAQGRKGKWWQIWNE